MIGTRFIVSVRSSESSRRGVVLISKSYDSAKNAFDKIKAAHEDDELVLTRMDREIISETPMMIK